jgi:hypothetical protein
MKWEWPLSIMKLTRTFHLQEAREAVLTSGIVRQAGLLGGVERRRSSVGGDLLE